MVMERAQHAGSASWSQYHGKSAELAARAEIAANDGRSDEARGLYVQATAFEINALRVIQNGKARTFGVTAGSAASLWVKADQPAKALDVCRLALTHSDLLRFAQLWISSMPPMK